MSDEIIYQFALEGARREIEKLRAELLTARDQVKALQKIIREDTTPAGIEVARYHEELRRIQGAAMAAQASFYKTTAQRIAEELTRFADVICDAPVLARDAEGSTQLISKGALYTAIQKRITEVTGSGLRG